MLHRPTDMTDRLTDILAFIERRAPQVRADLRGADGAEIDRLAELCPRPLPGVYLEFLRTMGETTDGFVPLPEADHRPASLREEHAAEPPSYPVERYFKVAIDLCIGHDVSHDWFIDMDAGAPDDPAVVRFEDVGEVEQFDGAQAQVIARTWTAMLRRRVFVAFALERRKFQEEAWLPGGPAPAARLQRLADVCARLGATPSFAASAGLHMLETPALSLLLELPPDHSQIRVRVGADARREGRRVIEVIRDDVHG